MDSLPLGIAVDPTPRPLPEKIVHQGRAVRLEPLSVHHVPDLWEAALGNDASWIYLRYGPFDTQQALLDFVAALSTRTDQPFWAVRPSDGRAAGWLSLCDINPVDASIEIGSVWFSPALQRTRAATEATTLLMRHAFDDLGYQRLVWRCAVLNAASKRAAERLGFTFEGLWRSAVIVKGWQRDVAWFSMLASEWPARREALSTWLDDGNFDAHGRALSSLR